jgi:hypothetical protein
MEILWTAGFVLIKWSNLVSLFGFVVGHKMGLVTKGVDRDHDGQRGVRDLGMGFVEISARKRVHGANLILNPQL